MVLFNSWLFLWKNFVKITWIIDDVCPSPDSAPKACPSRSCPTRRTPRPWTRCRSASRWTSRSCRTRSICPATSRADRSPAAGEGPHLSLICLYHTLNFASEPLLRICIHHTSLHRVHSLYTRSEIKILLKLGRLHIFFLSILETVRNFCSSV